MAISVNHYANGEWSVTGIPLDRNILSNSLYYYGELKPNYPVPARYHVSLDPDGLDTLDILANILFHADAIFYLHDYDYVD